jgi:type IV pilus assembly protein PilM
MYALGLHLDGHLLKTALLKREKHEIKVELARTFDLQKLEAGPSFLSSILTDKKAVLATGLDAWEVILRELELKLKTKREILSVLPFQFESQIPYPLEEAILTPFLHPLGKETTGVSLLATKKEHVQAHLQKMADQGIDPDWVSAMPTGLWRYARSYLTDETNALFYVGMEKSCCLCYQGKKLLLSQTVNFGLQAVLEAYKKDLIEENFEELNLSGLDPARHPHLSEALERFRREWERLLAFLEKKEIAKKFAFIGNIPPSLRHFLEQGEHLEKGEHPSYALPIGYALDALFQDEYSVQLRQQTFASPRLFEKRMKNLGLCLAALCVLTVTAWSASHYIILKKENVLMENIQAYRGTEFSVKTREGVLIALRQWSKSLGGQKVPFPYQLTVPKVSDLLGWISAHPHLKQEPISIKRVHYSLVKYPVLNKSNVPYQAKVDLEFTSSSPTLAREFHEALLKGEGLVNAKQEILWNMRENTYHTSFYLKGRSL